MESSIVNRAQRRQVAMASEYQGLKVTQAVEQVKVNVGLNPDMATEGIAEYKKLVEATVRSKSKQAKLIRQGSKDINNAALVGMIDRAVYSQNASVEQLEAMIGQITTDSELRSSVSASAFRTQLNRLRSAERGLKARAAASGWDSFKEEANAAISSGSGKKPSIPGGLSETRAEAANKYLAKIDMAKKVYGALRGDDGKTPISLNALRELVTPAAIARDAKKVPSSKYNEFVAGRELMREVITDVDSQVKSDQATFLSQQFEDVGAAQARFQEDPSPENATDYHAALKSRTEQVSPGSRIKPLTKWEVGEQAAVFARLSDDPSREAAQRGVRHLRDLESRYGKMWVAAANQLMEEEVLSKGQLVAAFVPSTEKKNDVFAERILRTSAMKLSELRKDAGVTDTDVAEYRQQINVALEDMGNSLISASESQRDYLLGSTKDAFLHMKLRYGDEFDFEKAAARVFLTVTYRVQEWP